MKADQESALTMTPEKIRRVIRSLEVYYVSGKKISELQKKNTEVKFETLQIGLMPERKYLYERINRRTEIMIKEGLIDEVNSLREKGFDYRTHNSLNSVGIKEVFKYFEGEYDYDEMVRLIKQNTRRYAKRQMTWFRKDKRIMWIEMTEGNTSEELAEKVIELL